MSEDTCPGVGRCHGPWSWCPDCDITSATRHDQAFVPGRSTCENIDRLVDDIFNNYIVRQGNVEPLYAQF